LGFVGPGETIWSPGVTEQEHCRWQEFVGKVKAKSGILAKGREAREEDAGYQLREPANSRMSHFGAEKGDIDFLGYKYLKINNIAWPDPEPAEPEGQAGPTGPTAISTQKRSNSNRSLNLVSEIDVQDQLAIKIKFRQAVLFFALLIVIAASGCAPMPLLKFEDQRPLPQREGPSFFHITCEHTVHGDKSLNVDRLLILQARLSERFGRKLEGKTLRIQKFFVFEAILRNSSKRDSSGKAVPNDGPFEPTLIAEIVISIDSEFFAGFSQLKLPQNSRATNETLTKVTNDGVETMLQDMEARWSGAKN